MEYVQTRPRNVANFLMKSKQVVLKVVVNYF